MQQQQQQSEKDSMNGHEKGLADALDEQEAEADGINGMSPKDKRAMILLVVLCALYPRLDVRILLITRLQTYCRASLLAWPSGLYRTCWHPGYPIRRWPPSH